MNFARSWSIANMIKYAAKFAPILIAVSCSAHGRLSSKNVGVREHELRVEYEDMLYSIIDKCNRISHELERSSPKNIDLRNYVKNSSNKLQNIDELEDAAGELARVFNTLNELHRDAKIIYHTEEGWKRSRD